MKTPCIVITRDRVSYTRLCIESLERFPDLEIHIVDHGSTWPAMVSYLDGLRHAVHYRGDETPRSLWQWPGLRHIIGDREYLVTDPDVVLDDACPDDWLEQMRADLEHAHSAAAVKVGLGLRLDDLPETDLAVKVRAWESAFWADPVESGRAFRAPVDTTLALYHGTAVRPDFEIAPALRLNAPYLLRHLPWYGDLDPAETAHYRARALPGTSHWINGGW